MNYDYKNFRKLYTNLLPKIPNKEININNVIDNNNLLNLENESKENINNESIENKNRKNNTITKKNKININYSTNSFFKKFNNNIPNIKEKSLISKKDSRNIKDNLLTKKIKNRNNNPIINSIYLSKSPSFYYSSLYKSFSPINKLNNNNDINTIINNSNYKIFNNSMTYLKNKNLNNNSNNNNSNMNINNIENEFNKSDSLNKNSSYLFNCLLNKYSKIKIPKKKPKTVYKNTIYKLSPFFKFSQNEKITARQIYRHYLKENAKDDNDNKEDKKKKKISNKFSGSYDYSHVICPGLKNIYDNDKTYMVRMNEIKKNNIIAFKKDFNIKDYQATLIRLMKKKVSDKFLTNLKNNFMKFNEKNYGMMIPKGRYINLANKLKNHLSGDAYESLKRMDKNYKLFYQHKKVNKKKKNNLLFNSFKS